jgi:hypothetical protein
MWCDPPGVKQTSRAAIRPALSALATHSLQKSCSVCRQAQTSSASLIFAHALESRGVAHRMGTTLANPYNDDLDDR